MADTVRKNYEKLKLAEKKKFIKAIRALQKTKDSSDISIYDKYVIWHVQSMANMFGNFNRAHSGPAFLPWHREFLRRFEKDLQAAVNDSTLGLPYWNWIEDEQVPQKSKIWSKTFLGGNGDPSFTIPQLEVNQNTAYIVRTGPFKFDPTDPDSYSVISIDDGGVVQRDGANRSLRDPLLRNFQIGSKFPKSSEISSLLNINQYDSPDWNEHQFDGNPSFRNTLEGWKPFSLHNSVHVWVSGTMANSYSPGDPVFFLNHCNVDRLWAIWQKDKSSDKWYPEDGTVTTGNGVRVPGHNRNDSMFPWNTSQEGNPTIESVLDYKKLGYTYDKMTV